MKPCTLLYYLTCWAISNEKCTVMFCSGGREEYGGGGKNSSLGENTMNHLVRLFAQEVVIRPFFGGKHDVCFSCFDGLQM